MPTAFVEPIYVTRTTLPPLEQYAKLLEGVWERRYVTNNGPLVQQLGTRLAERLGYAHGHLVTNGTIALQLALRALGVKGSAITTPYSYVATTNALIWEGITPVFADVEPDYLTLDPDRIAAALRPDTTAILATHVYGYPCRLQELRAVADRFGLHLLYDAAHAFGVEVNGESVLNFGDASTLSFHATKCFHTIEGGLITTAEEGTAREIDLLRSFGHVGRDYRGLGINAKLSELHAGVGLLNLDLLEDRRARRRELSDLYHQELAETGLTSPDPANYPGLKYNYSYFPVRCPSEAVREDLVAFLNQRNVFPRRYFEPSLNELPFVAAFDPASCPVSERAARTMLCLPLYPDLPPDHVRRIGAMVRAALVNAVA